MAGGRDDPVIRRAEVGDAGLIAALSHQLGYPVPEKEMEHRLRQICGDPGHAVYVAEEPRGRIVGWVHIAVRRLVEASLHGEIGGLVVDEMHRRRGIGQLLMRRAERWARLKGCAAVRLRSNVLREGAHQFYEQIGYRRISTQAAYRKDLLG
jgi:GNAT superfamily N-acetyltransferase